MNTSIKSRRPAQCSRLCPLTRSVAVLVGLTIASSGVASSAAAAELAAGVILYQQVDATTFRYTIDLNNTGTTTVGTLWYSWVPQPGQDFLAASPTNVVGPTGWTAIITHEAADDGFAIQWVNTTTPLASGKTLLGFRFDSHSTPAELTANSVFHTTFPVGTSFIYAGAPLAPGDAGFQFTIAPTTHPWTNPFLALDADNNGRVSAQDALAVIHELLLHGNHALTTPTLDDPVPSFFDVNASNSLSARDALLVIANILHLPTNVAPVEVGPLAVASPFALANVPEPGSIALVAVAVLALGAVAGLRRRSARLPK
ncbi:MAG TPA: dockerin type I domain-containing protein [Pirellulales bacterium]